MKFINFVMYLIVIFLFNAGLITLLDMFIIINNLSLLIVCIIIDFILIISIESVRTKINKN